MSWDPAQYMKFGDERLRPGFDLLARVGELPPGTLIELGCGTGVHARAIAARWPGRDMLAIDNSPEMLKQAAAEPSRIRWQQADLRQWQIPAGAALIFSNAVLHWIEDHRPLFERMMTALVPGGVLAVQMPRNFAAPSHVLMHETAASGPWARRLMKGVDPKPVAAPDQYYDWLAGIARGGIDIWETEYLHILSGEDPVLAWVRGTWLRPLTAPLDAAERAEFERRYAEKLRAAYPRRPDGKTVFPFRRIFIVART